MSFPWNRPPRPDSIVLQLPREVLQDLSFARQSLGLIATNTASLATSASRIEKYLRPQPAATIAVVSVQGRRPMTPVVKHAPPLHLSATQKVTLSVSPTLADGTPAPGPHRWRTSDEAALPITPAEDGLTCEVGTPNDAGSGTVTFESEGVRTTDIHITYEAPIEGEANLSAGERAISETEPPRSCSSAARSVADDPDPTIITSLPSSRSRGP